MRRFSLLEKIVVPTYDDPDQIAAGTVEWDYDKCTGCSLCVQACPADSIVLKDKRPVLKPAGENECIACGDCAAICPEGAIRVSKGYYYTHYFKTIDQGSPQPPRLFAEDG